jgi:hypothetical protein
MLNCCNAYILPSPSVARQFSSFLARRLTKFTCCARCGAVAPRVLGPTRQKIADKAQAGRLFCALPRGAPGTFGDTRQLS